MERVEFDDVEVMFQVTERTDAQRIVLVHASAFVSWYRPLVDHLSGFSTLRYRRRLQRAHGGRYRPLTTGEDAATCARLMEHVGWPSAHVVGHSYGALVALQLAMDAPDRVGSVALLEPAARGVSSSAAVVTALEPVIAAYRSGDTATAVDGFLRHVCGDGYRATLDRVLPGAFDEALQEADLFFQAEMPAVQGFAFGPDDARRVTQPVLDVLGEQSADRFVEGSRLVRTWFPRAEHLAIPNAGHLLMVQNPTAVATGLTAFFSHHPLGTEGVALRS